MGSFTSTAVAPGTNAIQTIKTQAFDCNAIDSASFMATLTGSTAPTVTYAMQVSNAQPVPYGVSPQVGGWQPPESSWVQANSDGAAVTTTVSDNGSTLIACDSTGLLGRWVRATWTPTAGSGGTVEIQFVGKAL